MQSIYNKQIVVVLVVVVNVVVVVVVVAVVIVGVVERAKVTRVLCVSEPL